MEFCSFSNILTGGGANELSHMFLPLDADLSAITQQMVDLELIRALPSSSSAVQRSDDRLLLSIGKRMDQSGNVTPSSPGSDTDINTNEATRGGSTFEMVRLII